MRLALVTVVAISALTAAEPFPRATTGLIAFAAGINGAPCHRDASSGCDIYLGDIDVSTGLITHALLVDGRPGAQWLPALSPNGRFLAYSDTAAVPNRIIAVDLTTFSRQSTIVTGKFPAFSADSARMYYSTTSLEIRVRNLSSGDDAKVPTQNAGTDPQPVGSRYVAFHEEASDGSAVPVIHDLVTGLDVKPASPIRCGHMFVNPAQSKVGCAPSASASLWMSELSGTTWSSFTPLMPNVADSIKTLDSRFGTVGQSTPPTFFAQSTWPGDQLVIGGAEASMGSGAPFTTTLGRLFLADLTSATPALTAVSVQGYSNVQTGTADILLGQTLRGVVTSLSFTDDPLAAGSTGVKAAHIAELRADVDGLRTRYDLTPFAWTDAVLTETVTAIKAAHISELRSALEAAFVSAGRTPPVFTTPAPTASLSLLSVAHIRDLRDAVRSLW
jgi:hypothetical protein